jgi:hypothetical protein
MFTWNDRFNLMIDYEVIAFMNELEKSQKLTTDDLHFCLLAMIGGNAISNPYAPYTYTTLDGIIMNMAQDVKFKATASIRTALMNAFNTLRRYGIITMNEEFNGNKNQFVCIDFGNVQHVAKKENGEYIQIGRQELAAIIKGSRVPHHLTAVMINYCSRFRIAGYEAFKTWKPNMSLYNINVSDFKGLSTWISQETSRTTWANKFGQDIKRKDEWDVSDAYFSKYCTDLVVLGILDRIIVNEQGRNLSYYFRPQHRECVEWAIKISNKQQVYMVEKKRGSFVKKQVEQQEETEFDFHEELEKAAQTRKERKASDAFR